jgi:hypothetical protein
MRLLQVAKKLKKMQVNVDIVNFGETSSNTAKVAPPSPSALRCMLFASSLPHDNLTKCFS